MAKVTSKRGGGTWCGLAMALVVSACGAPPAEPEPCAGRQAGDLVITELMLDPDGPDSGGEWLELFNPRDAPLELAGLSLVARELDGTRQRTHLLRAGVVRAQGFLALGDVREGANPPWIGVSWGDGLGALGNSRGALEVRCGTLVLDEVTWTRPAKAGRSRLLGATGAPPDAQANDDEGGWCDAPAAGVYAPPNAGTPGQPNPACVPEVAAATCLDAAGARAPVAPAPGDLLITEVMASPGEANDALGEWLEVFSRAEVDLNGLSIHNGAGASDRLDDARCLHVRAGGYALLARSADTFLNGGLPAPLATYALSLSGGNERVLLRHGDAGIDEVALLASTAGRAWQLPPGRGDNDDPSAFCRAPAPWRADGGGDLGSPGAENPPCAEVDAGVRPGPGQCLDPQGPRAVRPPAPGDVVITEWLADPLAVDDALGEYVEVLVKVACDLNGVAVRDASALGLVLDQPACLAVAPGSHVLFARSTSPALNGHLPPVLAAFPFSLNNGADTLRVLGADGGLLDAVTFTTSRPGVARQLDRGLTQPQDNDLEANLCFTPEDGGRRLVPGGDLGTPGAANARCP